MPYSAWLWVVFLVGSIHSPVSASGSLVKHEIVHDKHRFTLWAKQPTQSLGTVLLVHGRTWSSLPNFDLQVEGEDLSLMDGLTDKGFTVYAVDLRGYGATPRDESGWISPDKAASDILAVAKWIAEREGAAPAVFGFSNGATLAQLAAQKDPKAFSHLMLFGYWYGKHISFPSVEPEMERIKTTAEMAGSDFKTPGSISRKAIDAYVKAALEADPVKTDWRHYAQYKALDPVKVKIPTLLLQAEHDNYTNLEAHGELFKGLGHARKEWIVIPDADHMAFIEKSRALFLDAVTSFLRRPDR
jgi:alpha-beta hydrolase superfamily lysophospholipase